MCSADFSVLTEEAPRRACFATRDFIHQGIDSYGGSYTWSGSTAH